MESHPLSQTRRATSAFPWVVDNLLPSHGVSRHRQHMQPRSNSKFLSARIDRVVLGKQRPSKSYQPNLVAILASIFASCSLAANNRWCLLKQKRTKNSIPVLGVLRNMYRDTPWRNIPIPVQDRPYPEAITQIIFQSCIVHPNWMVRMSNRKKLLVGLEKPQEAGFLNRIFPEKWMKNFSESGTRSKKELTAP